MLLLMLASGFAGLGYQILWTQQFALCLGHESAAILAVVTAFFAGLSVGALLFGRRVEASHRPGRWYALAELVIGGWSLLLSLAMVPLGNLVLELTGPAPAPAWQWSVAFVASFLMLLPATAAMGVTLPAAERMTAGAAGRSIAGLYAANTLGAVLGVVAISFWLIPALGLARTSLCCVALNLLAAAAAAASIPSSLPEATPRTRPAGAPGATLARLAATGFLGIGFEILTVRVLSQVAEDTVYTFALLLAVYLIGTSAGAAVHHRLRGSDEPSPAVRERLMLGVGLACTLATAGLYFAEWLKFFTAERLGEGYAAALATEAVLALAAFLVPTLAMGALFSELCNEAQRRGVPYGRAIGINTLGATAAPIVVGVFLVPLAGLKAALVAVCAGYVLLAVRDSWRAPLVWLATAGVGAVILLAPPLAFIEMPEGSRLAGYRDGVMASVSLIEDEAGFRHLRINNREQEGATGSRRVDGRQALLPLLLHPAPRAALFLGVGAGTTSATAAEEPGVEVDAVELLPEVIEVAEALTSSYPDDVRARLHFVAADARRYVRTAPRLYDVIVADNFHPARSGTGALYTVEHFTAVRGRLAPGGFFCQWLPLHQLDLGSLQSIVRSFNGAFRRPYAILASNSLGTPTVGLIGRADDGEFDYGVLAARLNGYGPAARRAEFGVEDEFAVFGAFIAGPDSLARFAGDAPANTDDRPRVAYSAPRATYAPDTGPADRLVMLLGKLGLTPAEVVGASADGAWQARLAAYWQARNLFIDSGRSIRPSPSPAAMLDQVEAPLLNVVKVSPDFRPAYEPLLRLGVAVAGVDRERGTRLLGELVRLQPARTEAADALRALGPTGAGPASPR
jgi:spermidine synthase